MANSILTINMITREAIRLFMNSNEYIQHIDKQYDDQFAKTGAKIGTSLRIRLPNDFTVRTGPAASVQDTAEQSTTLVLATQKGVDVSFSSVDRTMSLDDFSKRVLAPMVNNLAGAVAADVMSGVEGGVANITTTNFSAAGAVLTPGAGDFLNAGAILDLNSAPRGNRKLILDPITMARTVSSLTGLFNPQRMISEQYERGMMADALGFEWYMDQTVLKHVTGNYTGTGTNNEVVTTLNGANQSGLSITVAAITNALAQGDIITIDNVNAVNRVTKQSTQQLRQFVVTAPVPNGGTVIPIYPAIVSPVGGQQVQYQTVDSIPANGSNVRALTLTSAIYRKNIAFVPEAITMATADLELPKGVHEAAREAFDGVAMRMISAYNIATDQFVTRLDVLYGYLYIRPEWVCTIPDII